MTKEEQWKREAEIKLDELDDRGFDFDNWSISDAYERGYCDCAESKEKRIAELEAQIEELKCCANCKYEEQGYMIEPCKSCNRYFPTLKVGARDKWERR